MDIEARPTDPSQLSSFPAIRTDRAFEIAPGVTVIPDPRINFVPNIGIVAGREAVLVVDTGIGVENGQRVLQLARGIAAGRPLYLTLTHFHPEHGYSAQAFKGEALIVYGKAQADELAEKGAKYLEMFRGYGPTLAKALEGVRIVGPDQTYTGERTIELGERKVVLRELPAHTRGDQIVILSEEKIVFTGDLVENRFFPIFADRDSDGRAWIEALTYIESLAPRIVVPGHGEVGGVDIIRNVRGYLQFVRDAIGKLPSELEWEEVDDRITSAVKARYSSWDNEMWIPFAGRVFYAELTGRALKLPE